MRALVVGAGAVGQVYAHHLAVGGAAVSFLVKPARAAACREGLVLYPRDGRPRRLTAGVFTSTEEVARERWDVALLAVSSTALADAAWLAALADALGDATVVLLQPGPDDRAALLAHVPEARLVQGMIPFIAYQAPLPGESRPPGVAFWLPPLSPTPLDGAPDRVRPLVAALRAGGLPGRAASVAAAPFATALLIALVAALEAEGWSLAALRRSPRLGLAVEAAREAFRTFGRAPLGLRLLAHPLLLRLLLRIAPLVPPFDLEAYLRVHFTKTGDQTRDILRRYLARARAASLPAPALEAIAR